jgi:hypothetical protein
LSHSALTAFVRMIRRTHFNTPLEFGVRTPRISCFFCALAMLGGAMLAKV